MVPRVNQCGSRREVEVFADNKCIRRDLSDVMCSCSLGCTVLKYDGSEENICLVSTDLGVVIDDFFTFLHLSTASFLTVRGYCVLKSKQIMAHFGHYNKGQIRQYPSSITFLDGFFLCMVNMQEKMLMQHPCP